MVFHTYTHNPDPDKYQPGTSFGGGIGTPFLRKQTWWPYMRSFTTYLARNTYLLERGKPVSDVLWYLGDEIQQKPNQKADFPEGYKYDYCNTDALMTRLDVKDGQWVTPEGISYRLMWIPDRLLPSTIKRLTQLVRKGGILVAQAPSHPATRLTGKALTDFRNAVENLWQGESGKGQVLSGMSLDDALQRLNILPDVKPTRAQWLHRRVEGADWYMVCAPQESDFQGVVEFHATGRAELWNPMNGHIEPLRSEEAEEYSGIRLRLERGECKYVVFRHDGKRQKVPESTSSLTNLDHLNWKLTFPQGWGVDALLSVSSLKPWCELPLTDEGKAFSGTVTYETAFHLDKFSSKAQYLLHLGEVEEIAVVRVNEAVVDTLWAIPYQTDITPYVRKGENHLTVEVTSTWHNRLVYDASCPESERKTWVLAGPPAGSELKRYGLMGPVAIEERR